VIVYGDAEWARVFVRNGASLPELMQRQAMVWNEA
jgi:hypothetical protein